MTTVRIDTTVARMEVPLLDLKAQYRGLKDELLSAIEAVLESQQLINGPAVKELENAVAGYSGCAYGVAVSSGTDALLCALMALNVGAGDEVITTPYTFFATAGCITRLGARPVFVDINAETFNIDAARIEAAMTDRTKALLPVHLFGQMADMDSIMEIAGRRRVPVIEDACQSIGAASHGRPAGSMGTVGCFSFFPSKNLGGAGDGGMIVTNDRSLGERMNLLRGHGAKPKYFHKVVGGNFRLDTIQAAYLLVKLKHLEEWSDRRRANASLYNEHLKNCPEIALPFVHPANSAIYNQYVIRAPRRDELRAYLGDRGIGTEVYYPLSLHQQECFRSLGYREGQFPNAERAAAESLALPIYPELGEQQIIYVARTLRAYFD